MTDLEFGQVVLVFSFERDQLLKIIIVYVGDHQTMKPQVLLDNPIQEDLEIRPVVIDMELHWSLTEGKQDGRVVEDIIPLQKVRLNEDMTLVQGPQRFRSLVYYFHS
jgi:hypothetical protein